MTVSAARRTAVVFGASGEIGSRSANVLHSMGYGVVVHGRGRPAPIGPPEGWAGEIRGDMASAEQAREVIAEALDRYGVPTVVINSMGSLGSVAPIGGTDPARWMTNLVDNVAPAYHLTRYLLPEMARARNGSLVHVSSVAGLSGMPGSASYAASKAAVISLTRTAAAEYGRRGVVVNALAPGFVETKATAHVRASARELVVDRQAIPKLLQVEDLDDAIRFLAETRSMTGQVLVVDNGLTSSV
jgi:3-oxoacyl-[acyl-carrier protein] reductase